MTITINTDNAAFADGNKYREIAAILRGLADRFACEQPPKYVVDSHGNTVGRVLRGV